MKRESVCVEREREREKVKREGRNNKTPRLGNLPDTESHMD